MIAGFRHKALERFYAGGGARGLPAAFAPKIGRALLALDNAEGPKDLDLPGFGLHPLTGDLAGRWSMVISRNWRIIFRFEGNNVTDVDFVDYH